MDEVGSPVWFDPRRVVPRWWVIILAAAIAASVAVAASRSSTPTATTSSTYVLSTASNLDNPFDVSSSLSVLRGREVISTFAEILESSSVLDTAIGQTAASDAGAYSAQADVFPGSNIIKLTVTGPASGYAQDVATSVGDEATVRFEDLYPIYRIDPLDVAPTPQRTVSDVARNILLASGIAIVAAGLVSAVIPLRRSSRAEPAAVQLAETVPLLDESIAPYAEKDRSPIEGEPAEDPWNWQQQKS